MNTLPKGVRTRRTPLQGGRYAETYVADVTYRGRRRTGTAPTLEDAIILRRELLAELTGDHVVPYQRQPQRTWTWGKAAETTLQVAWKSTEWAVHATRYCRAFGVHVGRDRPLDTIDTTTLDQWVRGLEDKGLSDATINRHLAAVSKVFSVAQDRGGVAAKPKFPRRRETQGRVRWLTSEEERACLDLLEQWGRDDERDLFILLVDTGLRVGEALRLEWRDVDLRSGMISVWRTKNDQPRSVPLTKRVRGVLEYRAAKVISVPRTGPVVNISRHSFRQTWDRMRSHLGFARDRQFVPHALRHTCASRLVQRGVSLRVVQEWMGHKAITVTMRYAHLAPANLRAAAAALDQEEET